MNTPLFPYILHLADNALILGQRNSEWCGHGPVLEQDMAITNISLDLLGQARHFYQYAADLYNSFTASEQQAVDTYIPAVWKTYGRELNEDDLAFLRTEPQYLNGLLTELPNGDWAQTILRQFFFSTFQYYYYQRLQKSSNTSLAAITEKAVKEVAYHMRWSGEWVIRLGDGTDESHRRIHTALHELWMYTGELFIPAVYEQKMSEQSIGVALADIQPGWHQKISTVFTEATLSLPSPSFWQSGGKQGRHTEYMGHLLTEMQYLQRTYPNAVW